MQAVARFERVSQRQYDSDWRNIFGEEPSPSVPSIPLPTRATTGSAGYDFFAPFGFELSPGKSILIPTGIRSVIDPGWMLLIAPRSSLGFRYRLQLDNTVAIIDSDYSFSDNEGHILIRLTNESHAEKTLSLRRGDAFVQGILLPFGITADDHVHTTRNGGIGSTNNPPSRPDAG